MRRCSSLTSMLMLMVAVDTDARLRFAWLSLVTLA